MRSEVVNITKRAAEKARDLVADATLSEDEIAIRFVLEYGDDYRSVPGLGWMRFDRTYWKRDIRLQYFDDVRNVCRKLGATDDRSAAETKRLAAAKTVAAVVQLARADQRIVVLPEEFDANPLELNTPAGITDLRDGAIRPHARDYFTKQTTIAPDFTTAPTRWVRFLGDVFGDDEDVIAFVSVARLFPDGRNTRADSSVLAWRWR
jgi:putative DNA primase/helicase